MWHALRAELDYSRWWLLGGLGMAAGVSALVSVIFWLVQSDAPDHVAAGLRGMFLVMAPMVVGFIIQTYRSEERRTLLLMAGPLAPRQIAGAMVLLPVVLLVISLLAAGAMIGVEALVTGNLYGEALHMAGYVGGLIFMMMLMGLLAQEATAAYRQRRTGAAVAGWASFGAAVLLLVGLALAAVLLQGRSTWTSLHLGNLLVAVAAGFATVALYSRRTDFTR